MLNRDEARQVAIKYAISILGEDLVNKYRSNSGVSESVEPQVSEDGRQFMNFSICLSYRDPDTIEPAIDDSTPWDCIVDCNVFLDDGRTELVKKIINPEN